MGGWGRRGRPWPRVDAGWGAGLRLQQLARRHCALRWHGGTRATRAPAKRPLCQPSLTATWRPPHRAAGRRMAAPPRHVHAKGGAGHGGARRPRAVAASPVQQACARLVRAPPTGCTRARVWELTWSFATGARKGSRQCAASGPVESPLCCRCCHPVAADGVPAALECTTGSTRHARHPPPAPRRRSAPLHHVRLCFQQTGAAEG